MSFEIGARLDPRADEIKAKRIFERLGMEISDLPPMRQLALVNLFKCGADWSELGEDLKDCFRAAAR